MIFWPNIWEIYMFFYKKSEFKKCKILEPGGEIKKH